MSDEKPQTQAERDRAALARTISLLREVYNLRCPTPGNWPGEHLLPGWMRSRIEEINAKYDAEHA